MQSIQGSVTSQSEFLRSEQARLAAQARELTAEINQLNTELRGSTPRRDPGGFARRSEARAELAEIQSQIATNANALRALASVNTATAQAVETATTNTENYNLALAKLKATAEDTRRTLTDTLNVEQVTPNFQAAIAASNAYYNNRIAKAQEALATETQGTEAYNQLQVQIFELGRQRIQAERQITDENRRLTQQLGQERIEIANAASNAEVEGFKAATDAAKEYTDQLQRQISAIPRIQSPDAQYGNFTSQLRQDFEDTESQGRSLLGVMREIARLSFGPLDLDARIPDPDLRQQQIDDQIAAEARGQQTLLDIRQDAAEQGRQFLNSVLRREEREIQRSVNANARQYRQFANLVSNTFLDLATGRVQSFQTVATEFIRQSIRIIARAFIEHQIRLRLDNQLTAARIANIEKVAAAQSAAGAGGLGNLAGLGNLPGLGRLGSSLSGGGAALGVSALLFPEQIRNTVGGISDLVGGFLSNLSSLPDRAFGAQQVFLKIGDNEIKDITDIQRELVDENRL